MKEEKQLVIKMDKEKAEKLKTIVKNELGLSVSAFVRNEIFKKIDFENMKVKGE